MNHLIEELYVEVYWRFYRIFRNEKIAAGLDVALLVIFQVLNIYSIVLLLQKLLKIELLGYIMQGYFVVIIVVILLVSALNFFIAKRAKKTLKKDDQDQFVTKRFSTYILLSIGLWAVARFAFKG